MNFHLSIPAVTLLNSARAVSIDPAALFAELGRRGGENDVVLTVHNTADVFSGLVFTFSGLVFTLSWVDVTGQRQAVQSDSLARVLLEASVLDLELFRQHRDEMAYIDPALLAEDDEADGRQGRLL